MCHNPHLQDCYLISLCILSAFLFVISDCVPVLQRDIRLSISRLSDTSSVSLHGAINYQLRAALKLMNLLNEIVAQRHDNHHLGIHS